MQVNKKVDGRFLVKNKKGFLLGEYTLKMIIAVFSLLLLFYLLFTLYSNYKDEQDLKMAKASLEEIEQGMKRAKEKGEEEITILNPGHFLGYWKNDEEGPEGCQENCLCFCLGWFSGDYTLGERINICREPVCKNFDEEVVINQGHLYPPVDLKINYKDGKYEIEELQ